MSWFRIEHKLPSHGKVAPISDAAFRLHITAGCWCAEHMTDGHVPAAMPEAMTKAPRGKALAGVLAELLKAGLWERTEDGYLIHDYLAYNMSRAEYELKALAGRSGGVKSGASRRSKNEARASVVLEQKPSTSSRSPQAVSVSVSVSEDPKVLNAAAESERPFSRENPEVSASAAEDLRKKSECLLRDPAAATFDSPANWPEVQEAARDFADSMGLRPPKLGLIPADRGVLAIVTLFAAGFSPLELAQAAHAAKTDPWFRDPKAKRGLSSLSVEVVRRLLEPASGTHRTQTPEELAKIKRAREVRERHLAAERDALAASVTPEALAAAERGLGAAGIRRPA